MSEIPQEKLPPPGLTDAERESAARLADNPLDLFQGKTIGWLEDFFNSRLTASVVRKLVPVYAVGDLRVISKDLTAQTSEYVYEDELGTFLYCNGVAVSQTTYADLYAYLGANAYAADSGGNFLLPDCRGRSLFFCGTNAATQRDDNDGVAVASRQAKHSPANGLTFTPSNGSLAVTAGTLAVTPTPVVTSGDVQPAYAAGGSNAVQSVGTTATGLTGAPALTGTVGGSIGGSIGSGMTGDGPAHIFIGSLLVRF